MKKPLSEMSNEELWKLFPIIAKIIMKNILHGTKQRN